MGTRQESHGMQEPPFTFVKDLHITTHNFWVTKELMAAGVLKGRGPCTENASRGRCTDNASC